MVAHIPGFALQVTVDRPDVQGRVRILKVHSRGKQIGKDVDFEKIARRTPGVYNLPSNTWVLDVTGANACCCAIFGVQQFRMTPHLVTCSQLPDAFPASMAAARPLHALLSKQEAALTPAIAFSTGLLCSSGNFTHPKKYGSDKVSYFAMFFLASFCIC